MSISHLCIPRRIISHRYTDTVLSHARTATKSVGDFGKEKLPTKVSSMSAQLKDAVKVGPSASGERTIVSL